MKGRRAPAYSVGRSRRTVSLIDDGPGPAHYSATVKPSSPRAVIGTAKRDFKPSGADFPGPCSYRPQILRRRGPSAFILSRQTDKESHNDLPGPADYSPLYFGQTFSYTLRGRNEEHLNDHPPGPATYYAEKPRKGSPKAVFGCARRMSAAAQEGPGPIYMPCAPGSAKGGSFGRSKRMDSGSAEAPGPGTYIISRELVNLGALITPRRPLSSERHRLNPGPADYQISQSFDASSPRGCSIGRSARFTKPKDTVPASVGLGREATGRHNPEFSIGRSKRVYEASTSVPGPGTYLIQEQVSSPKYTMRKRPFSGERQLPVSTTKGPADYSPKATQKISPRAVIGSAPRTAFSSSIGPPPGTYNLPMTESGPRFSFTRSRRTLSTSESIAPGPGEYNHIDTIGQL